jgi:hypothetical protein
MTFVALTLGCGGAPTGPSSPAAPGATSTTTAQPSANAWNFSNDANASHVAVFSGANGSQLDIWKESTGNSAVRVRTEDGTNTLFSRDSEGRLIHLEDGAGNRMWVEYSATDAVADVTVLMRDGTSWRGLVSTELLIAGIESRRSVQPQAVGDIEFAKQLLGLYCNSFALEQFSRIMTAVCLAETLPNPTSVVLIACVAKAVGDQALDKLFCSGADAALKFSSNISNQPVLNTQPPTAPAPVVSMSSGPYDGVWNGVGRGSSNFGSLATVQVTFEVMQNQVRRINFPWRIDTPPGTVPSTYCGGGGEGGTFARTPVTSGAFSFLQQPAMNAGGLQYEIALSARFASPSSASGTIAFRRLGAEGPSYCGSATIPWTASK